MLFLIALAVSLVVFVILNEKRHQEFTRSQRIDCLLNRQLAQNQRRVIIALLTLEGDEQPVRKEHIRDIAFLQVALRNVPEFNCMKGG